jgi:acid stress-induced BolA-like protein IbaG/YrbA
MEETIRQALLAAGFTDDEIQLETTPSGRVAGFVIAERFDGMAQLDRQEMLWNELENHLDPASLASIVSLLTMTPDEIDDDLPAESGG